MKKNYLEGCRLFLGLDGGHLKGSYGGVLLSTVSIDRNKELFYVAFAVVEIECKDSWRIFLEHLYFCLGGSMIDCTFIIISYKQKVCTLLSFNL